MQALRERLIDALETHSATWPPACPPLEPTGYWVRGRVGPDHRPRGERVVGVAGRGPRLVLAPVK